MATQKVKYKKVSWKALCKAADKAMNEKITSYDFKGRQFKEPQKKVY